MDTQKASVTVTTDDLVTIPQAALELEINFSTLYRWIHKGKVRPFRIGKQVFITAEDLKTLKEDRSK